MQENRIDSSAIKRNEPFCSLDLTRYFLTEKNLCQIKKWREQQKRKLDFSNGSWVRLGQIPGLSRSIPRTKFILRAISEIMLVYRRSGKTLLLRLRDPQTWTGQWLTQDQKLLSFLDWIMTKVYDSQTMSPDPAAGSQLDSPYL